MIDLHEWNQLQNSSLYFQYLLSTLCYSRQPKHYVSHYHYWIFTVLFMEPTSAHSKNSFKFYIVRTGVTTITTTTTNTNTNTIILILLLLKCRCILQISELMLTSGFYGPKIYCSFLTGIFTFVNPPVLPRIYVCMYVCIYIYIYIPILH